MPDRAYSLALALRHLANPHNTAAEDAADVEIEASQALEAAQGAAARGLIVPGSVLVRAQRTSTDSEGGALVGQTARGFAGALRAALVTGQVGATVLADLRGDVSVPTLLSGAVARWLDEGAPSIISTATTGRGVIEPQTVSATVPVSRRLLLQGQPDVADLIAADLLAALAHEIDAAALGVSTDANAPSGLRQALAAEKVTFGASIPSWGELLDMEQDVLDANVTNPAFILAPVMARALKEAETLTGSGRHILAGGRIADRPALVTPAWSATEVVAGGFEDLLIAQWGGIDLRLDRATGAASDTCHLRAFADVGFLVRRAGSFAYGGAP